MVPRGELNLVKSGKSLARTGDVVCEGLPPTLNTVGGNPTGAKAPKRKNPTAFLMSDRTK